AAVPADRFAILVGTGRGGEGRHVLREDAPDPREEVEAALAEAWLHGVPIDWTPLWPGTGRRVALPPYPFTRQRYWALDRVSLAPASAVRTADATEAATEDATGDDVEAVLLAIWRDLFGIPTIGPDDQFGALGGTSLLGVQLTLEIQNRLGCMINVHRAGGGRVTVRRLAELIRARRDRSPDASPGGGLGDELDQGDDAFIDADL